MTADIVAAGAELARRTRAAQGLEATITDPAGIEAIARIVALSMRRTAGVSETLEAPGRPS